VPKRISDDQLSNMNGIELRELIKSQQMLIQKQEQKLLEAQKQL
jgi:hypothetical protein